MFKLLSFLHLFAAIGVTDKIDEAQLYAFASGPQYVWEMQSFMELGSTKDMVQRAMLALCDRATFERTVPPFTGTHLSPVSKTQIPSNLSVLCPSVL